MTELTPTQAADFLSIALEEIAAGSTETGAEFVEDAIDGLDDEQYSEEKESLQNALQRLESDDVGEATQTIDAVLDGLLEQL
jgi:peptide subunit release factor 1 (eRF1)